MRKKLTNAVLWVTFAQIMFSLFSSANVGSEGIVLGLIAFWYQRSGKPAPLIIYTFFACLNASEIYFEFVGLLPNTQGDLFKALFLLLAVGMWVERRSGGARTVAEA